MTRRMLMILAAVTTLGGAASAQGVAIADDGWSVVDRTPQLDYITKIDDNGWSRVEKPARQASTPRGAGSPCTQIERAQKISGADCGTMSTAELSRIHLLSHQ